MRWEQSKSDENEESEEMAKPDIKVRAVLMYS
jgi:hypothetical protein